MVGETVSEIVDKVRAFRAPVVLLAGRLDQETAGRRPLYLVPNPDPEAQAVPRASVGASRAARRAG